MITYMFAKKSGHWDVLIQDQYILLLILDTFDSWLQNTPAIACTHCDNIHQYINI